MATVDRIIQPRQTPGEAFYGVIVACRYIATTKKRSGVKIVYTRSKFDMANLATVDRHKITEWVLK